MTAEIPDAGESSSYVRAIFRCSDRYHDGCTVNWVYAVPVGLLEGFSVDERRGIVRGMAIQEEQQCPSCHSPYVMNAKDIGI